MKLYHFSWQTYKLICCLLKFLFFPSWNFIKTATETRVRNLVFEFKGKLDLINGHIWSNVMSFLLHILIILFLNILTLIKFPDFLMYIYTWYFITLWWYFQYFFPYLLKYYMKIYKLKWHNYNDRLIVIKISYLVVLFINIFESC